MLEDKTLVEVHSRFKRMVKARGLWTEALARNVAKKGNIQGIKKLPADLKRLFVTAHDIDPLWHIKIQAAFQANTVIGVRSNFPGIAYPVARTGQSLRIAHRLVGNP